MSAATSLLLLLSVLLFVIMFQSNQRPIQLHLLVDQIHNLVLDQQNHQLVLFLWKQIHHLELFLWKQIHHRLHKTRNLLLHLVQINDYLWHQPPRLYLNLVQVSLSNILFQPLMIYVTVLESSMPSESAPIRAPASLWRCSRIMHLLRDLHPTLLSALEGIVDQVINNMNEYRWSSLSSLIVNMV